MVDLRSLGQWTLGDALGGGRSAQVWAATDPAGREAAIKVVRQERGRRVEDGVRFLREGRLLSDLDHPAIPRLYEMGVAGADQMFLAIERIPGKDLRTVLTRLAKREIELRRSVRAALLLPAWRAACAAVAHAHERGIVHGDVTPSNIVADGQGRFGLVDWGLARRFDPPDPPEPRPEHDGKRPVLRVHGTPGYVAPERLSRPLEQPLPPSDVYSLGAVLYHLLCFAPAYAARTVPGRLAASFQPPADPRERAPAMEVPDALAEAALRAMAVEPGDRYPSAAALGEAVAAALA